MNFYATWDIRKGNDEQIPGGKSEQRSHERWRQKKYSRGDFNNVVIPHNKNQSKNRISFVRIVTFDRFRQQNVYIFFID